MHISTTLLWQFYVAANNLMYLGLHVKCLIFSFSFNQIWFFWADSHKSFQYNISWKSVQIGAEPIQWSDRLMDITKLLGIFREFVKLLQNNYRVYELNILSWNILENMPFLAIVLNFFSVIRVVWSLWLEQQPEHVIQSYRIHILITCNLPTQLSNPMRILHACGVTKIF